LEEPHIPPANQEQRLAASLHPIVSFVVLGSIIIREFKVQFEDKPLRILSDGLSIPFFKIGRSTVTLSSTFSRPPPTPDWLNLTKRMGGKTSRDQEIDGIERGEAGEASGALRRLASRSVRTSTQPGTPILREPPPGQGLSEGASRESSLMEMPITDLETYDPEEGEASSKGIPMKVSVDKTLVKNIPGSIIDDLKQNPSKEDDPKKHTLNDGKYNHGENVLEILKEKAPSKTGPEDDEIDIGERNYAQSKKRNSSSSSAVDDTSTEGPIVSTSKISPSTGKPTASTSQRPVVQFRE